jgi:hypothetical protein
MVDVFIDDPMSSEMCQACSVNAAVKNIKFRQQNLNSFWNSNVELLLCLHCYNQLKKKMCNK